MKCGNCKKRINQALSFKCKCNIKFCSNCRLPEKHYCENLEKFQDKQELKENLIKLKPKKMNKID